MRNPYTPHYEVANSVLRRERDGRRRRELVLVLVALLPVVLGLLSYTWMQVETLRTGYRIGELERELHRLDRQRQELTIDAAQMSRAAVVERRAGESLGLTAQTVEQTLYYDPARRTLR